MIEKNLLPQAVIDSVERMLNDRNRYTRETYQQRVEMIKLFCEQALQEYARKKK